MTTKIQNKNKKVKKFTPVNNNLCCKTFSNEKLTAKNDFFLDTLAQLCTPFDKQYKVSNLENLKKRAKAKYITHSYLFKLIELRSNLNDSYWNTFYCSKNLVQDGKTITSTYCNNRWCIVCNRIRTAKLINHYKPILEKYKDLWFVTLTRKNVDADQLTDEINRMSKLFSNINQAIYRRYKRGRGKQLTAIRKTEVTISRRKDYNPHFHIIVIGEENARYILKRWLEMSPAASYKGQDIRPLTNNSLIELFKYTTKILTKNKKSGNISIYTKELDVIFKSMYRRKSIQPYGIIKSVSEDVDEIDSIEYEDLEHYDSIRLIEYDEYDWYYLDSGEALTGYVPDDELKKQLNKSVK